MQHWSRHKFKNELAKEFLSALRAIAEDCSMKTTNAKSTTSIYAATLESYQRTILLRRKLRSDKLKLERKKKSLSGSKFFDL